MQNLYRKNGNLLKALSKALCNEKQSPKTETLVRKEYSSVMVSDTTDELSENTILRAGRNTPTHSECS